MSGGKITGNSAVNGNGGGIHAVHGTFDITGSAEISNNTAGAGGGVHIGDATGDFSGGLIENNESTVGFGTPYFIGGGGIAIYSENPVTISGCTIRGNTSSTYGGGIYLTTSSNTLTLTGGRMI
jgi:hypothetical protein